MEKQSNRGGFNMSLSNRLTFGECFKGEPNIPTILFKEDVKEAVKEERKLLMKLFKSWEVDEDLIKSFLVKREEIFGKDLI